MHGLREQARRLVAHPLFQRIIVGLIVLNGIVLGLETSPTAMAAIGPVLLTLDQVLLWIFVVELGIAIFGYGLAFVRDPWRVFDAVVIGIALVPAGQAFSVLRSLRILRVLRLINAAPSLKRIIAAMVHAIPGMGSIACLLGLLYYVAAVMATKLFGAAFPEWFGDLGASIYTLFQVMTLESWSMGIVRPVMERFPYAWVFFIPFIMLATFTMLNLFVGVIVSAMQAAGTESPPAPEPVDGAKLHARLESLSKELAETRQAIERYTSESARPSRAAR